MWLEIWFTAQLSSIFIVLLLLRLLLLLLLFQLSYSYKSATVRTLYSCCFCSKCFALLCSALVLFVTLPFLSIANRFDLCISFALTFFHSSKWLSDWRSFCFLFFHHLRFLLSELLGVVVDFVDYGIRFSCAQTKKIHLNLLWMCNCFITCAFKRSEKQRSSWRRIRLKKHCNSDHNVFDLKWNSNGQTRLN